MALITVWGSYRYASTRQKLLDVEAARDHAGWFGFVASFPAQGSLADLDLQSQPSPGQAHTDVRLQ